MDKKYPIEFTTDYTERSREKTLYKEDYDIWIEVCRKWKGKEISLKEAEDNIDELGAIIFDGNTIEIYNDHRE